MPKTRNHDVRLACADSPGQPDRRNLNDRVVGRAMEYRADEVAGRLVGPKYGVAVLEKLGAGIEPSFGLFATHPATPKRIERQQLLGLQLANQVDSRVGT